MALGLLLSLVALQGPAPPASSTPADVARFVIAIGYNAADPDPRPTLRYADDDAARFFHLQLGQSETSWLLTTFDAASARTYPELAAVARPPSKLELMRVLGEVRWRAAEAEQRGKDTELIFYFAGHGLVAENGEGSLVFADGTLTRSELQQHVVKGSPAGLNHIFIDACASYYMVARGDDVTQPVPLSPEALDVLRDSGALDAAAWSKTGVLTATSSSADVHETPALGSGVFSFLLRSALLGAGDSNGDGVIEYAEARAFIAAASAGVPDARATLDVFARAPTQRPNVALSNLGDRSFAHTLELDGSGPRHVRVLDAWGVPYAELRREPSAAVRLALVGSPFYVVQVGDAEAQLAPRAPGAYALSSLSFSPAPKERGVAVGLPARFFGTAYGPAFLAGFLQSSTLPAPRARAALPVVYADAGAPPEPPATRLWAATAWSVAGASALVAVGGVAGNLLTFQALEARAQETGQLDADLAVQVEAWRATALVGAVASVVFLGVGGGLWLLAVEDDLRSPALEPQEAP